MTRANPPPIDSAAASAFAGVDWASMNYSIKNCAPVGTIGSAAAFASPQPALDIAVVFVNCRAGAGSPSTGMLIFDSGGPNSRRPRLRQTLVPIEDDWLPAPGGATASGKDLSIEVYGYSRVSVPRCCPDLHVILAWTWSGGAYVATTAEPPHQGLPLVQPS